MQSAVPILKSSMNDARIMGIDQPVSTDSVRQDLEEFVNHVDQISTSHHLDERREICIEKKIIRPFLETLGWDVMSPEVHFELYTGEGDADYALCIDDTRRPNPNSVVLIEAKAWHNSLDNAESQLRRYLEESSTTWGLSSNGKCYRLYRYENESLDNRFDAKYSDLPKHAEELIKIHRKQITA